MPRPKFKRGNTIGKGGAKPGAGRPPEWLKKKCQDIVDKDDLIGFLRDVAKGKDFPQSINEAGEVVDFPAKVRDRKEAAIYLIERGYGKPAQTMDVTVDESSNELGSQPSRDLLLLAGLLARECSKGA